MSFKYSAPPTPFALHSFIYYGQPKCEILNRKIPEINNFFKDFIYF